MAGGKHISTARRSISKALKKFYRKAQDICKSTDTLPSLAETKVPFNNGYSSRLNCPSISGINNLIEKREDLATSSRVDSHVARPPALRPFSWLASKVSVEEYMRHSAGGY